MAIHVAVVGAGDATETERALAREVGSELGRAGAILICGGLGGVMETACQGAREQGGVTVGLLPGVDRTAANPFVSVAIATGLGELRNGLVVRAADALVAVGGEWGTLSEIALALKIGKPVVGLASWDISTADRGVQAARDAHEAVQKALALAARPAN